MQGGGKSGVSGVSTHSRPKAAGFLLEFGLLIDHCFNTQPPEGGWVLHLACRFYCVVSTHSRPKAAGVSVS